jgi:hypothetical protein
MQSARDKRRMALPDMHMHTWHHVSVEHYMYMGIFANRRWSCLQHHQICPFSFPERAQLAWLATKDAEYNLD